MKELIQRPSEKQTRTQLVREPIYRGVAAPALEAGASTGAKSANWRRYANDRLRHFASGR